MNFRKKTIISLALMLLPAIQASGQHYIGVRGGYGLGHGRFEGSVSMQYGDMKMVSGLWSGGIAWKYYSREKFVGGIGAEIEFLQKGYEYHLIKNGEMTDTTYRRRINSIQIPLIWQPHANMFGNRFRIFLNLGISAQYNFPVSKVEMLLRGESYYKGDYRQKLVRDNPFGFGLLGGFGFNIIRDRWEFTLEARYYFGYGDILRHTSKYPGEYDPLLESYMPNPRRSPLDNISISTGFFYRLTDGAHNPKPSRRQQRLEEKRREEQMMEALRARQPLEPGPDEPGDVTLPESTTEEEAPPPENLKSIPPGSGRTISTPVKTGAKTENEGEAEKQKTTETKTESKEDGNNKAAKSS